MEQDLSKGTGFDPHRLWQIIRRRRFYLVLPVLVIGGVLGAGVTTITPIYVSSSRLLLEDRGTGTDVDKLMTQEARRVRDLENLVMVRETLLSQELLMRVIRNLRLREDPAVMEQARALQAQVLPDQPVSVVAERLLVHRLRRKAYIYGQGGNLFVINVEDNDAFTAYKLTQALTEAFIDEMSRRRVEGLIETTSFTNEQLETARDDLRRAEGNLEEFKRTVLIQDTLSDNPVSGENSREAATALRNVQLDVTENEREIQRVERLLFDDLNRMPDDRLPGGDPEVATIRDRLTVLERQDFLGLLTSRAATATGISPQRQRIGIQRNRLSQRMQELSQAAYPDLSAANQTLLARRAEIRLVNEILIEHEARIDREYRGYETRIKERPAHDAELRRLEQDLATQEEIFNRLIDAETSNELRLAANESGFGFVVRVVEAPYKAMAPDKPDKRKIALMGAVLALGIGAGAIFLSEYVDTSFKDVEDVHRALGLEVVGTLPRFADDQSWSQKKRKSSVAWRTAFVVTLVTIMVLFVLHYRQSSVENRVFLVDGYPGFLSSPTEEGR